MSDDIPINEDQIHEARRVTRVNSKGEKTKKMKCGKGYKISSSGKSCVPITGSEKAAKRKSSKKAVKTKRAQGSGAKKKTTRKRLRAMKKRNSMGL